MTKVPTNLGLPVEYILSPGLIHTPSFPSNPFGSLGHFNFSRISIMNKFISFLVSLSLLLHPASAFGYTNSADSRYSCSAAIVQSVPKGATVKIFTNVFCNSPHGYRLYITSPVNHDAVKRTLLEGDGPINKTIPLTVSKNEFKFYVLKIEPTN